VIVVVVGVVAVVVQGGMMKWLMRTLGERRVVVVGLASGTLGYLGYALATHGWMMYAIIVANFLSFAVGAALNAIVSRAADPREQGLAMGSLSSLSSLMGVIAPLVGTPLLARVSHLPAADWRVGAPFYLSTVLCGLALVFAVWHFSRHRPVSGTLAP
jgi:DHA1 family tetracycline resistance protein-like MFS transporter